MARWIVLLRGINLVSRNRVPMPELRARLDALGYEDVATVVQSGNIVLSSNATAAVLADDLRAAVRDGFGVDTPVIVRSAAQLAEVIAHNPLPEAAADGKRFQVFFCEGSVPAAVASPIESADLGAERVAFRGREIYAWHAGGIHRSPLARLLVDKKLETVATARNWNTVRKLNELT